VYDEEALGSVSREQIEAVVRTLRQGDLLDGGKLATLFSPDAPAYPEEVGAAPHDEPLMTMEARLQSGLCAVISQDCDIRRLPDVEPYVVVAPIQVVSDKEYRDADAGLSSRFFAYPEINGQGNLALDMRVVMSVEKFAIASPYVRVTPCPLHPTRRAELRSWLGRRFSRVPFPDDIEEQLVTPLRQAVKRAREQDAANVCSTFVFYGLRYLPSSQWASFLVLYDPARMAKAEVAEDAFNSFVKRLEKAVTHWTRHSPYSVSLYVHPINKRPALDLFQHEQLPIEIDDVDVSGQPYGTPEPSEPTA
jgi:hypothetical protein